MNNVYRVYHLNRKVATFTDRDDALTYINDRVEDGQQREDYEILDNSDN